MEVDSLIERHRQRLVEHRKFLASTESTDDAEFEPQDTMNAETRHQEREKYITTTLAKALHASERNERTSSTATKRSAAASSNVEGSPAVVFTSDFVDDDCSRPRGVSTSSAQRRGVHDSPGSNAAVFFGFAGQQEQSLVEDRLLQQHLNAAGRYYTNGPADAMYQRSVWWLQNKERHIKDQQEQIQSTSLSECTFQPNLDAVRPLSKPSTTPTRTGSAAPTTQGAASVKGRASRSVSPADVASLSHHLLRQQHARHLRNEAQRRMAGPDISNWEPRRTTPKEFELGKRTVPIASLRQPVWGGMRGVHAEEEAEDSGERSAEKDTAATTADRSASGSPPAGQQQRTTPREDAPKSAASSRALSTIAALQRQLEERDRHSAALEKQILEQQATIQSLRREVDVAKNMVRKMTLESAK